MDGYRAAADFLTVIPRFRLVHSRFLAPAIPSHLPPVIPAKVGIQRVSDNVIAAHSLALCASG